MKKLLNLLQYKVIVFYALQPCDPRSRIHFCSWFLQSVHDGEVDPHLTFVCVHACVCVGTCVCFCVCNEASFHLCGHVSSCNSKYWISVNPHLIHKVPLHEGRMSDS
jgi:hypothetical protein